MNVSNDVDCSPLVTEDSTQSQDSLGSLDSDLSEINKVAVHNLNAMEKWLAKGKCRMAKLFALHKLNNNDTLRQHSDNPNTTQTLEYTKDKYNAKIIKRKVSPKVPPTTYKGRRIK
jgi:hypothetical protein